MAKVCSCDFQDPFEPFETPVTCIIQSARDQYEMEKLMSTVEDLDVKVMFYNNNSFRLEGDWVNVEKAIELLKDRTLYRLLYL